MPARDLDIAQQFRSAAEDALRTGAFEPLLALLAADVECVTPLHTLQGVDAIKAISEELGRGRPTENFEVEFENGEWEHLGDGRYACRIRALYRSRLTEDQSYTRDRSFELAIRDGKIVRYEMGFAG